MWRDVETNRNKQRRKKPNNQPTKQTYKKNSRFRNNRISVLVVLVLFLKYPALVLVFKQRL
jgi:hypothetical protein